MSKLPPLPHWCESGSPFAEQMQAYALAAIEALQAQIGKSDMQIRVLFECAENGVTGTTSAPVKRVELEDDGTLTAVLDYWPPPAPQQKPLTDAITEFNRAIDFAIEQGIEAAVFLRNWREGDTSEWPEFHQSLEAAHNIGEKK